MGKNVGFGQEGGAFPCKLTLGVKGEMINHNMTGETKPSKMLRELPGRKESKASHNGP